MSGGLLVAGVLTAVLQLAQYKLDQPLSTGSILLANEKLGDPNFAESVILIVRYDEEAGTVGLVINDRTEIPLSRIFPKAKRENSDPVYKGGPVAAGAVQALLRSPEKMDQARHVTADVYVSGAKDLIDQSVSSRQGPSKFRVYLGYAGWAPGQLEAEIRAGAWSVMRGTPKIIFDENPDSLWNRLMRESHMQMAAAGDQQALARRKRSKIPIHSGSFGGRITAIQSQPSPSA